MNDASSPLAEVDQMGCASIGEMSDLLQGYIAFPPFGELTPTIAAARPHPDYPE